MMDHADGGEGSDFHFMFISTALSAGIYLLYNYHIASSKLFRAL